MENKELQANHTGVNLPVQGSVGFLAQEHQRWQTTFEAQPVLVQRFLESQAQSLAEALGQATAKRLGQLRFTLPDQVVTPEGKALPVEQRQQSLGGLAARLSGKRTDVLLRQRLDELEAGAPAGVALGAGLMRYAIAAYMVTNLLPEGRTVSYATAEGEEIPSLPAASQAQLGSAITASTDAIAEEGAAETGTEAERGELLVPYVPAARRFYLPQWVAFDTGENGSDAPDSEDRLLVNSVEQAGEHLAAMQRFLRILHTAVALAPYLMADETYQRKRYGMLGQLVNQGRAMARYQTRQLIARILHKVEAQELNRGLSLSLPYFDDQDLALKVYPFQIIPAGRIMFAPAFVVRAARQEQAKVAQDTRLSPSTRSHLLSELHLLEKAFEGAMPRSS